MPDRMMVFCDFDGTITEEETLEAFLEECLQTDVRKQAENMLRSGYSLKQGIKELMGQIPSKTYKSVLMRKSDRKIRAGFGEFLRSMKSINIPVIVVSGGLEDMVMESLREYRDMITAIYCGKVDLSKEYVHFYSDYESEEELVSKVLIMGRYKTQTAVCIGDFYTDKIMAMHSDIVFARDRLVSAMKECGKNYYEFDTFFDIISVIENYGRI